jgi:two-component system C4-dicarboxylate transport response regulator DctD
VTPSAPGPPAAETGAGAVAPLVLVVDDDPHVRQAICWALEDEGLTVAAAADGRQALERATPRPPGLVVLDLTLPDADGYTVARELRARHGPDLAILAITADGQAPAKAARAGAYAYLLKPFDLPDLLAAVWRGLAGAGAGGG